MYIQDRKVTTYLNYLYEGKAVSVLLNLGIHVLCCEKVDRATILTTHSVVDEESINQSINQSINWLLKSHVEQGVKYKRQKKKG